VLKSRAVPKGEPEEAGNKRLAIEVEDHTLEFGRFDGTVPAGEYGAGTIEIWDKGEYDLLEWREDTVLFALRGVRCHGLFRLIRFARGVPHAWLLLKLPDQPVDAGECSPKGGIDAK
jgi:DNA ligase D-like protein (predicted 3'-phosphoesterase)